MLNNTSFNRIQRIVENFTSLNDTDHEYESKILLLFKLTKNLLIRFKVLYPQKDIELLKKHYNTFGLSNNACHKVTYISSHNEN